MYFTPVALSFTDHMLVVSQVNSVTSSYLATDATEGRLRTGNWEADATPAGATPILH